METKDFNKIVNDRKIRISKILQAKATEYAKGGDRLSNFKEAALFMQCTPEKALLGFVTKHMIALRDFTNDLENGHCQSEEMWDEKLGDIINYMILLEALLAERFEGIRERGLVQDNRPMSERAAEALAEMRNGV